MAALQEQWEMARKARQQEIVQRQQAVQETLAHCQQNREANAVDMRAKLAAYYGSVQDETKLYLTQVEQQRRVMAQQTAQQLQVFDAELRAVVAELRAANQADMAELQQVTQEVLATYQRDRAVMRDQQQQVLSEYVDELQGAVADCLAEIAGNRRAMAVVDQAQRHRDREALTDDVEALREEFAIYREQMRDFRENLRQSVWGDASPTVATPAKTTTDSKASSRNSRTRVQAGATTKAKSAAATKGAKAPAPVGKKASPAKSMVPTEEAVFNYLQAHHDGARLTAIESTLGINRFQAVDALRSLIQKELIVQKDRTYRIQEEAVL
ncbi:MAG: hypothetical protein F6K00_31170 [Leptolyngbya sp. SIOISBB]|nr:hypothetical protein [Leptolyngbya sp. SIOISBB]